jgi:hypothetical protein
MGTTWNTAHWVIILCLEKDNLPVWFGKAKHGKRSNHTDKEDKKPDPVTDHGETKKNDSEKKDEGDKKEPKKKKPNLDKILGD